MVKQNQIDLIIDLGSEDMEKADDPIEIREYFELMSKLTQGIIPYYFHSTKTKFA